MPGIFRSACIIFRAGVAAIRLDTGRYDRSSVNNRLCLIVQKFVIILSRMNNMFYYMTSDNVFSDWQTSLETFFDITFIHLARRNAR